MSVADAAQIAAIAGDDGYACPEPLLLVASITGDRHLQTSMYVCPRDAGPLGMVCRNASDP